MFTVAPSDLTFLLSECRRCFYLKVVEGERRASSPMPSVFTRMDRSQRAFYDGKPASAISSTLPAGTISTSEHKILSKPIPIPGTSCALRFRGTMDALISFDSGAYGVVDFKTSSPSESSKVHYVNQLHAYALGLENAEFPLEALTPVTKLGLLCFDPGTYTANAKGLLLSTTPTWIPMVRSDAIFLRFMTAVGKLLTGTVPASSPDCAACRFAADRARR